MNSESQKPKEKLECEAQGFFLKQFIFFPDLIVPLTISHDGTQVILEQTFLENRLLFLTSRPFSLGEAELPFHFIGTACKIMEFKKLHYHQSKVLLKGVFRARLKKRLSKDSFWIQKIEAPFREGLKEQFSFLEKEVFTSFKELVSLGKIVAPDLLIWGGGNFARKKSQIIHYLDFSLAEQQSLLELGDELLILRNIHRKIGEEILSRKQKILTL